MPSTDYLSMLATYNQDNGITATFSEMKKTARRMQKLHDELGSVEFVDFEAYFLLHSDKTGEEATDNVLTAQNKANAARRLAA
jgi:ABC-type Zn uptake system ZnuABC Zn-binding protein ZnuA